MFDINMEIINIMYLIDYELKFKSWQSYVELPFGLSFLMDEFELEHYFSQRVTFLKGFDAMNRTGFFGEIFI
ncbi:MAG: hypothetical protein GAK29_04945 [Acinetobacter bereziniae]|uniref:Uncharacterized protein n=1 Tax=Acinetobacter bereziniae TaxID=106648 RepID=A0A833PAN5_ACIBZ|nr:MAG: hypothetical protein GAK29_04945 [Acinetobacter bereziniae]